MYKVGDRVQRLGWQITATGTIKAIAGTMNTRIFYLVEWDFRGMENDITTVAHDDLVPIEILEALQKQL